MFKMIGAIVVYGFATYGLLECLDWLTRITDEKEKACASVEDQIREFLRKQRKDSPDPA